MDAESEIPLQDALKWLSLPRELGKHPETGEVIEANNGRYGPYVRHEKDYRSLEDGDDVYEVTFERAMELLSQPKKSRRQAAAKALREFPAAGEGKPGLKVMSGRYGPYVTDGKVNATLPKSEDAGNLTYERALELVKKKAESGGKGGRKKATGGRSGKKTATKTAAKKTTAKKSVAKKPAAKKSAPKK
jgi:DNA topoisomerase-1